MQDNESSSFRVNKIHMPNPRNAESALLTLERAQKLDLLIHLVSNLSQSLVICGPNGIGKTTLLEELKKCDKDALPMLSLQASSNVSFESFQDQLINLLLNQLDFKVESQEISTVLFELDKQNQKVVIIIDNAGQLVPGLIDTLIQYASENKCLRIIFALTLDELHIKKSSDRAIDDCHFIDIPPLTKKQCGVFLQNLSARTGYILSFNQVNDQLIEKLYRDTHGIPGKMISEVSKGASYKLFNVGRYKWIAVILISALLGTLGIFFIFDELSSKKNNESTNSPLLTQAPEKVEILPSYVEHDMVEQINDFAIVDENSLGEGKPIANEVTNSELKGEAGGINAEDNFVPQSKQKDNTGTIDLAEEAKVLKKAESVEVAAEPEIAEVKPNKSPISTDKTKVIVKESKVTGDKNNKKLEKNVVSKGDDSEWVLNQPKNYFTMQLIVLSRRDSVLAFLKEYPEQLNQLNFFKKRKQGNSQYVVIYGSFKNAATASKKMKSLPPRFRKAWVRRFSGLHKMIKK